MDLLITLTHARLRAGQGDLRTARTILRKLLEAEPSNAEARALLDSWQSPAAAEPAQARSHASDARGAAAARRRVARLEEWLGRIRRRAP